ncbi:Intein/homing endonuclease [Archaeoglobus sulfaticallidus PM70-1]|uniref:Replication factor C small subunit n=1 Tax=Archaeoglobus sulfaticallidus PM70-1 TaxID=387631 RepID=N0BAU1_9EURY|nr:replication factor C small subunit [Archaeoglobus sulfaticallidus]AGK60113.1 Intein/homing endonuclease [Archaeoglobus sulfaticallidus PM70-1]
MLESEIWVEKYRPKTLDEVVGQHAIVQRLKGYVEKRNIPHLLFAGPPGTGKTASAIALTRDLFGENWRDNFIEMNASVSKSTPVTVRVNGAVERLTFEDLDRMYFNGCGDDVEYADAGDLEVLTVDEKYRVRWARVSKIIRHKARKILRVRVEGGGVIELTGNHAVMLLDKNGSLVAKKASEIKEGDFFISFVSKLGGSLNKLSFSDYLPRSVTSRVRVIDELEVNELVSWSFGAYAAEGAVSIRGDTSGQVVYTFGSNELEQIGRIKEFSESLGLKIYETYTSSGFDRSKYSAKQIKVLSTQLAKFVRDNFYDGYGFKAKNKRIPGFVYELPFEAKMAFLRGLADGDGYGEWANIVRISSASKDLLIDVAWLSRMTGIESSIFDREVRLIWKGGMGYQKSELLPAEIFVNFFERISDKIEGNWRYEMRHQLYENRKTVSKQTLKKILDMVDVESLTEKEKEVLKNLRNLVNSDLHVLRVREIEAVDYNDFVYDVSVPGNEMFFAGNVPVLLHNSDERGIDVVRHKIKEFARTAPIGDAPFKIIFLDEADALTADAQAALRRTMEMYSKICRFILSCNYVSRIIEPIQSRCAVFKFRPISEEAMKKKLLEICEKENVEITEDGLQALIYVSGGDFRKAINALQGAATFGEKIDAEVIFQITATARPEEVKDLLELALSGNFLEAREKLEHLLIEYGMSGEDVVNQLFKEIISSSLDERLKVVLIDKLGEIDFRLTEGSNERIQLDAYLAFLSTIAKRKKEKVEKE